MLLEGQTLQAALNKSQCSLNLSLCRMKTLLMGKNSVLVSKIRTLVHPNTKYPVLSKSVGGSANDNTTLKKDS